jgi:hypothetical protein
MTIISEMPPCGADRLRFPREKSLLADGFERGDDVQSRVVIDGNPGGFTYWGLGSERCSSDSVVNSTIPDTADADVSAALADMHDRPRNHVTTQFFSRGTMKYPTHDPACDIVSRMYELLLGPLDGAVTRASEVNDRLDELSTLAERRLPRVSRGEILSLLPV